MSIPTYLKIWFYVIFVATMVNAVALLEIVHILYTGHLHVILWGGRG